jgi:uncharacterized damage-inducible protein DinB
LNIDRENSIDKENNMNASELFGHWNEVRSGLLAAMQKLTDAQLDFKPREGLWSLRETVVHIAGAEDGWLRCYTANRWHENPPLAADYPTIASLKALLAKQHAITESQFDENAEEALTQVCLLPWGAQVTMG